MNYEMVRAFAASSDRSTRGAAEALLFQHIADAVWLEEEDVEAA